MHLIASFEKLFVSASSPRRRYFGNIKTQVRNRESTIA